MGAHAPELRVSSSLGHLQRMQKQVLLLLHSVMAGGDRGGDGDSIDGGGGGKMRLSSTA